MQSLVKHGFEVIWASSCEEGMAEIVCNREIDIVLMDIDLGPGIDGLEAARRLGDQCKTPIVFHSASNNKEVIARARQISRYGYIEKNGRHFALLGPAVDLALSTHHVFEIYELTSDYARGRDVYGENALLVSALCDADPRYTWINDPHPDFVLNDVIGRLDIDIAANEGTQQMFELKRQVLRSGRKARKDIQFPLSNGDVKYHVIAAPMQGAGGDPVGVKTISFVL
jgi:CheY-like chemotaxis protein